jgi:hypothetical protein
MDLTSSQVPMRSFARDVALDPGRASARASKLGGISRPNALVVLRLTTSSNLTGNWTGSSAGFSLLSILPEYAARRQLSTLRFHKTRARQRR